MYGDGQGPQFCVPQCHTGRVRPFPHRFSVQIGNGNGGGAFVVLQPRFFLDRHKPLSNVEVEGNQKPALIFFQEKKEKK